MQVNDEIKSALGPLAGRDSMYFDVNETTLTLLKLLYISCYEREVHVFEVKVIYQMSKMGIKCNFFCMVKEDWFKFVVSTGMYSIECVIESGTPASS